MGRLSKFESKMDKAFDNAAGSMFKSPISPVQMTKRAEKEMQREKLVSAGVEHAPTLYNILVNPDDDEKLSGYYPTLAGEMETYLKGKAGESGLHMDGHPLVRFIVDDKLKSGKFDVIAENVSASIIQQLREEEMQRYGIDDYAPQGRQAAPRGQQMPAGRQPNAPRPQERDDLYEEPYPQAAGFDDRGYGEEGADDAYFAAQEEPAAYPPARTQYQEPVAKPAQRSTRDFGSSRASLYNMSTGDIYNLEGMHIRIGRDQNNDIVIRDKNVSRTHAEIVLRDGIWLLNDLGSTNGSFLNDREISQVELRDGDMLTFGMTNFEFREG